MHLSARDPHLRDTVNKLTVNTERKMSFNFRSFNKFFLYLINEYQNKKPFALKLHNNASTHGQQKIL